MPPTRTTPSGVKPPRHAPAGLSSARLLAVIVHIVLVGCATVAPPPPAAQPTLLVFVASAVDSQPMPDVRVFVLSASGQVLAEGTTNGLGAVTLVKPAPGQLPAFVLAEHRDFFLGGSRWRPGADEYYIHLALGAVR